MTWQRLLCASAARIVSLGFGYLAALEQNYRDARVDGVVSVLALAVAGQALVAGRGRK
jgi:hypothetical protein